MSNKATNKVTCPTCGFDHIHLAGVAVDQNGLVVTIERDGVRIDPKGPPSARGRGSETATAYWCECGHRFEERRTFHKGAVEASLVATGDIDLENPPEEFWRN